MRARNALAEILMRFLVPLLTLAALLPGSNASESAPVSISTVKPERRDVSKWIKLPAAVEADAEITLYAKVSGFLRDLSVDIGDKLKPGQLIGKLDAPELDQDVKYAEAQSLSAQADVQATAAQLERIQLRNEDIDARQATLEAELLKAKAELGRTETQRNRTQKLFSANAATELERDYVEDSSKVFVAAVKTAETKVDALKSERDLWKKDIDVGKAAVEAAKGKAAIAQAAVDRARVWLAYTEIKIPQIGPRPGSTAFVTKRFVSNGDLILGGAGARGAPIVTLTVSDPVRVIADLPESDSIYIASGTPALVMFYAWPRAPVIAGKVSRTSEMLAASTRTLRVEVDIPNADGKFKPGMMVNAEFTTDTHKAVLAVPSTSVVTEKQSSYVFTVDAGKARKTTAKIGFQDHGWTEIESESVSENTSVIKDARGIVEGAAVEVKP